MLDLNPQNSTNNNVSLSFAIDAKESRLYTFVDIEKNMQGIAIAFPTIDQMESLDGWIIPPKETLVKVDHRSFKRLNIDYRCGNLLEIAEQETLNKQMYFDQLNQNAIGYLVIGFPLERDKNYHVRNAKDSQGRNLFKSGKPILEVMPNITR